MYLLPAGGMAGNWLIGGFGSSLCDVSFRLVHEVAGFHAQEQKHAKASPEITQYRFSCTVVTKEVTRPTHIQGWRSRLHLSLGEAAKNCGHFLVVYKAKVIINSNNLNFLDFCSLIVTSIANNDSFIFSFPMFYNAISLHCLIAPD